MQAALDFGTAVLRMSDSLMPVKGSPNESVSVGFEGSNEQVLHAFKVLSENGGIVKQPLSATFFSLNYGEVIDKFGIEWKMAAMNEE